MDVVEQPFLACTQFEVKYTGKEAHASAFPERGINAADALTVAQTAIGCLRQHIRQTDRIHGIVTHGGDAPNIVPALTKAHYIVRAKTLAELDEIHGKVVRCFEAGALATGSTLAITEDHPPYAEVKPDVDGTSPSSAGSFPTSVRCSSAWRARPTWATSRSRFRRSIR
jgi:metal-dependent amidase/aminoacylase/carboxypeptidase family protein